MDSAGWYWGLPVICWLLRRSSGCLGAAPADVHVDDGVKELQAC